MAERDKDVTGFVKKETMLIVACICLGIGFLAGIAFNIYKTGPAAPAAPESAQAPRPQMPPRQQPPGPSPEQARLIQDLEGKTAENPEDLDAWTQLANLYFDTNQYKQSIAAYRKSIEIDPDNPDTWTDMGVMYRRSKQPDKAIEAFDKAISLDPRHESARFNKGIVLMHDLNDLEGGAQVWQELSELNPNATTPNGQPIKDMVERLRTMK